MIYDYSVSRWQTSSEYMHNLAGRKRVAGQVINTGSAKREPVVKNFLESGFLHSSQSSNFTSTGNDGRTGEQSGESDRLITGTDNEFAGLKSSGYEY